MLEVFLKQLRGYTPCNAQEEADLSAFMYFLKHNPDVLSRQNPNGHITASAWLVNASKDKVVLIYHNLYDSWAWTGGHADGDGDLLQVAIKEAMEETGLTNIRALDNAFYSIEVLNVQGHVKKGQTIAPHIHYNVTYLLEADESESLRHKPDENAGVSWFALEDAVNASTEPYLQKVYRKLNEKLSNFKGI